MTNNKINYVERELTQREQFRTLEIAHETRNHEIQRLALIILNRSLHPPKPFVALKDIT